MTRKRYMSLRDCASARECALHILDYVIGGEIYAQGIFNGK